MESVATGVTVLLPGVLRTRAGGASAVHAAGTTVAELIASLEEQHPGLRFNLCYETGELRPFVNIFVDGQNIRYLRGLATPIHAGARVHILPSVAGG